MKKFFCFTYLASFVWAKNLALFNQYRAQLYSLDPRQREQALPYFMQEVDEESLEVLREHLLYERNPKILKNLLNFFASRKSKEDFFLLLDFVSLSPTLELAIEAAKILKEIHQEKTRRELLTLSQKSALYFLVFLQVFPTPTETTFYDVKKKLQDESFRLAILSFPQKVQDGFIEALKAYFYSDRSLLNQDPSSILIKTMILEKAQEQILPEDFANMPNSELADFAYLLFLQKKFYYNRESIDFEKLFSQKEKREVVRMFLLQIRSYIQNEDLLIKIAKEAESKREILWYLRNFQSLNRSEQEIFCQKNLKRLPKSFFNRQKFLCEKTIAQNDFTNLRLYLENAFDLPSHKLYLLLRGKDPKYRKKAYSLLSKEILKKHPTLYEALILHERDKSLLFQLILANEERDIPNDI